VCIVRASRRATRRCLQDDRPDFALAGWVADELGLPSWWGKVDGYADDAVLYLLGAMNDDHLGTWTQTFTTQQLATLLPNPGGVYTQPIRFKTGDGDYLAWMQISRQI